jgi:polyisoprenoid-binding protein YceI
MKKSIIFSLFLGLTLMLCSFDNVKLSVNKTDSFIRYTLKHPMHESIGTSKDFLANCYYDNTSKKIVKLVVAAPVASFDSQNSSRDSHALETLEATKFPKVSFVSKAIKEEAGDVTIVGTLDFHGIKKEITIKAKQTESDKKIILSGSFNVSLDKFNVEKPSMMGVAVEDNLVMDFKTTFDI